MARGFQERFTSNGKGLSVLNRDPSLPLSVYMHALGGTGITAYGGLLETGALKDGEQVFISTAAGAVGSVAAQIAKIKGCYVVGSTGIRRQGGLVARHAAARCGDQLQDPAACRGIGRGDAERPRRLFRECRRRASRRRPA